jgi:hypothetical protein
MDTEGGKNDGNEKPNDSASKVPIEQSFVEKNGETNSETKASKKKIDIKKVWELCKQKWKEARKPIKRFLKFAYLGATIVTAYYAIRTFNSNTELIKENKLANDSIAQINKEIRNRDTVDANARFKLQSRQTNAQIRALENQVDLLKYQFDIENEPIISVQFDSLMSLKPEIQFYILNYGKLPVKIIKYRFSAKIVGDTSNWQSWFNKKPFKETNMYVKIMQSMHHDQRIDPFTEIDLITFGFGAYFFWAGEIVYENPIKNGKVKTNKFLMRLIFDRPIKDPHYYTKPHSEFFRNDNY